MIQHFYTDRGLPLAFWCESQKRNTTPVLTVELYSKWYEPFLVYPDGTVDPVQLDYDDLREMTPEGESYVGDHVWNPVAIERYTESRGWTMDPQALEMITGRWEIEHKGRYQA